VERPNEEVTSCLTPQTVTFYSIRLRVYDREEKLIEVKDVADRLKDATVLVHFTIKHYHIQQAQGFESFSANIEQINLIEEPRKKDSPYSKTDLNTPIGIKNKKGKDKAS
jgi:hypothetical protein